MDLAAAKTPHQRQMKRRKNMNPHFKNFVEHTSLHGVKYICDPNRHWLERCFWCIAVIGFIISLFGIYNMKMAQWKETSMTIELASTSQHISTLPYPGLTICGALGVSEEKVESFMNKRHGNEIYKIADILGMAREAFDEMYNISSTENDTNISGKRFVISDQQTLDFFQYYSQQNCLIECSTKRALKECGCVLFFMPHNESTYICSDENSSCALDVALKSHYDSSEKNFANSCDCLPSCNYTDYKVISYESFSEDVLDDPLSFHKTHEVEIIFRNDFFYPKVRTYTYSNYEMIDSTVTYLDTFLGISIMTVTEIFYYLLLYVIDYLKSKVQTMLDGLYMPCELNLNRQ